VSAQTGHARPGLPTTASQGAPVRRPALSSGDGRVGASRLARKHVSFRRLQNLDSERHGAAAVGEQSPTAVARRAIPRSKDRRASARGGESRARSGQCQPARRTTGRPSFPDVSNRAGGSIESGVVTSSPQLCFYRHSMSSKLPGSFSRRFAPQGVGFREVRARCRKTALNEQGTRGARRKALNRSELECLGLGEWSRTSLSRRLPRRAALSGVSVPEVRFESFAQCPPNTDGQRL
jgi:hypothetical protein